jgi:hypothetical protein
MIMKVSILALVSLILGINLIGFAVAEGTYSGAADSIEIHKRTMVNTTINITINEDLTYDVAFDHKIHTLFWNWLGWSWRMSDDLKRVTIEDEIGDIPIKNADKNESYNIYYFNTNYKAFQDKYRSLIIRSRRNEMTKLDDKMYLLAFETDNFKSSFCDNPTIINIKLPSSLKFMTANRYNKDIVAMRGNEISFYLLNPEPSLNFLFIKTDSIKNFKEINADNKTFLVEDNERLLKGVFDALENRDLILDYPAGKKDLIVIGSSNISSLYNKTVDIWGMALTNNLILIDDSLLKTGSDEEVTSVLIHELTHYSENSYFGWFLYPEWLTEGAAVYSEIKYIKKKFPDFGGSIPTNLDFYQRMPIQKNIEKWYTKDKDFFITNINETYMADELYSLYGFPLNYYSETYGEDTLKESLKEIRDKKIVEERRIAYIDYGYFENLTVKYFMKNSNQENNRENFFFPKKQLFLSDQAKFFEEMKPFIAQPISAEKLGELLGTQDKSGEEKSIFGVIILIISIVAVATIAVVLIVKIRAKNSGNNKKRGKNKK